MKILGLDPGQTTGVAQILIDPITKKFKPVYFQECKDPLLIEIKPLFESSDLIIIEDFAVDPREAKKGSFDGNRMIATQVIGAAKLLATLTSTPYHLVSRLLKPVAYGVSGQPYVKGKKKQHNQDALAYAVYWGVKHGYCLPFLKSE
jgi:hypothetical protein